MGDKDSSKYFSSVFSSVLKSSNHSQAYLAKEMDISRAYVSKIAKGSDVPSPERITEISKALGLLEEDEVKLHTAAAADKGFKINIPDDW